MVIQTELYPGAGYKQQTYSAYQEGCYSGDDSNSNHWGMQMKPNPSVATPHYSNPYMMQQPDGGRAQQHEGWYGNNKQQHHQNGWQKPSDNHHGYGQNNTSDYQHGYGSGGQMPPPYNCNSSTSQFAAPGGRYMNPMPTTEYKNYHEAHVPTAPNTVEVVDYEFGNSGINGGYPRCPNYYDQNSGGRRYGGCQRKEWIVKSVDD